MASIADIANLRIFRCNNFAPKGTTPSIEDYEGLFVFKISNKQGVYFTSLLDGDNHPVIRFKLLKLLGNNKIHDLAVDMIDKLNMFPPKTNEILAKQLSEWILSSFLFHRPRALCRKLVFVVDIVVVADGGAMVALSTSSGDNANSCNQQREEDTIHTSSLLNVLSMQTIYAGHGTLNERLERRAILMSRINPVSVYAIELVERDQQRLLIEEQFIHVKLSEYAKHATNAFHVADTILVYTSSIPRRRESFKELIDNVCTRRYMYTSIEVFHGVVEALSDSSHNYIDALLKYLYRSRLFFAEIGKNNVIANSLEHYQKALENLAEGLESAFLKLMEKQQQIVRAYADGESSNNRGTTDCIEANEDNHAEFSEVHSILAKWFTSKLRYAEGRRKKLAKQDISMLPAAEMCLEKVPPSLEIVQSNDHKVRHDKIECCICLDKLPKEGEMILKLIHCGHMFHRTCIFKWLPRNNSSCPYCRARSKVSVCLDGLKA